MVARSSTLCTKIRAIDSRGSVKLPTTPLGNTFLKKYQNEFRYDPHSQVNEANGNTY